MSDGRHFTDYRPNCLTHDLILKQNNISNTYDLKRFLQHNARDLQQINRDFYERKNTCCHPCELADPNKQIRYWDNYSSHIGYGNQMNFCSHKK